ncbi:hypothetical protein KM043_005490 [Ampulex compressa]|nr:hypothetical protein KM043_005490 [Ampulex compressa]
MSPATTFRPLEPPPPRVTFRADLDSGNDRIEIGRLHFAKYEIQGADNSLPLLFHFTGKQRGRLLPKMKPRRMMWPKSWAPGFRKLVGTEVIRGMREEVRKEKAGPKFPQHFSPFSVSPALCLHFLLFPNTPSSRILFRLLEEVLSANQRPRRKKVRRGFVESRFLIV